MQPRFPSSPDDFAQRIAGGEERSLARLLSGLEDGEPWAADALRALRRGSASSARRGSGEAGGLSPGSHVIGITGPPGTGKSTLVDKLIVAFRARGERVGVLAVDPSSPFTGGAILGDRIRMQSRSGDEGLFIRSLASRGRLGGLSGATAQAARALEAAGYGIVIVETVGIGQSEVDIARLADSVVLVSMPGSGDDIQTIKAGVMEIGDIFVVNKADREGAERTVREIRAMLEIAAALAVGSAPRAAPDSLAGHHSFAPCADDRPDAGDLPPVLKTVAESGEGVDELVVLLDTRWAKLRASGALEDRRTRGAIAEARSLLSERVLASLEALEGGLEERLAREIVRGEIEAAGAADILFASILSKGDKG